MIRVKIVETATLIVSASVRLLKVTVTMVTQNWQKPAFISLMSCLEAGTEKKCVFKKDGIHLNQ